MDAVRRDAEADVVGHHHGIAFPGQDAFHREGFGGGFAVGADREVAHDDQVLDGAFGRQDQFAGLGEGRDTVDVVARVGAGDLDDGVAVERAEQVTGQARGIGLGRLGLRQFVGVFEPLDLGIQHAVLAENVRGLDGQHLEGVEVRIFQRGLPARAQQEKAQKGEEDSFHDLTNYS